MSAKRGFYEIHTNQGKREREGYICRHVAFCDQEQIGRITWYAVTHLPTGYLVGYVGGRKNVEAFCREFDRIPDIDKASATEEDSKSATKRALTDLAHKYRDTKAFARSVSEACDHSLGVTGL